MGQCNAYLTSNVKGNTPHKFGNKLDTVCRDEELVLSDVLLLESLKCYTCFSEAHTKV